MGSQVCFPSEAMRHIHSDVERKRLPDEPKSPLPAGLIEEIDDTLRVELHVVGARVRCRIVLI